MEAAFVSFGATIVKRNDRALSANLDFMVRVRVMVLNAFRQPWRFQSLNCDFLRGESNVLTPVLLGNIT
jgi:hypothetical protein